VRFCHSHDSFDPKRLLAIGSGAVVGHALVPGVGGVVGAIGAALLDHLVLAQPEKKRVFLSFDFEHDRRLKAFMVGQAKNERSPFVITDYSLKEAAPEPDWEEHAAERILQSDLVMVMLGEHTHRAQGVLKEVWMAKWGGVPTVQVRLSGTSPRPVPGGGRVYDWSWDNLEKILN
jgi:hypothetical protein